MANNAMRTRRVRVMMTSALVLMALGTSPINAEVAVPSNAEVAVPSNAEVAVPAPQSMTVTPIVAAVRADAEPFSFRRPEVEVTENNLYNREDWDGFSVHLCNRAIDIFNARQDKKLYKIHYMEINAADRFSEYFVGSDPLFVMICGAVSVTEQRQKNVPFSNVVFLDARAAIRKGGSGGLLAQASPRQDAGPVQRVGYVKGTTAEQEVATGVEMVPFANHLEGLAALACGDIDAHVGDREILKNVIENESNTLRRQLITRWRELAILKCEDPETTPNINAASPNSTESGLSAGDGPDHAGGLESEDTSESHDSNGPPSSGASFTGMEHPASEIAAMDTTDSAQKAQDAAAAQRFLGNLEISSRELSLERYAIPVHPDYPELLWALNLAIAEEYKQNGSAFVQGYFPGTNLSELMKALVVIRGGALREP